MSETLINQTSIPFNDISSPPERTIEEISKTENRFKYKVASLGDIYSEVTSINQKEQREAFHQNFGDVQIDNPKFKDLFHPREETIYNTTSKTSFYKDKSPSTKVNNVLISGTPFKKAEYSIESDPANKLRKIEVNYLHNAPFKPSKKYSHVVSGKINPPQSTFSVKRIVETNIKTHEEEMKPIVLYPSRVIPPKPKEEKEREKNLKTNEWETNKTSNQFVIGNSTYQKLANSSVKFKPSKKNKFQRKYLSSREARETLAVSEKFCGAMIDYFKSSEMKIPSKQSIQEISKYAKELEKSLQKFKMERNYKKEIKIDDPFKKKMNAKRREDYNSNSHKELKMTRVYPEIDESFKKDVQEKMTTLQVQLREIFDYISQIKGQKADPEKLDIMYRKAQSLSEMVQKLKNDVENEEGKLKTSLDGKNKKTNKSISNQYQLNDSIKFNRNKNANLPSTIQKMSYSAVNPIKEEIGKEDVKNSKESLGKSNLYRSKSMGEKSPYQIQRQNKSVIITQMRQQFPYNQDEMYKSQMQSPPIITNQSIQFQNHQIQEPNVEMSQSQAIPQFSKTDYNQSQVVPQFSKTDYNQSQVVPQFSKTDYNQSQVVPQFSKTDYNQSQVVPQFSKTDYNQSQVVPQFSKTDYNQSQEIPQMQQSMYSQSQENPQFFQTNYSQENHPQFFQTNYSQENPQFIQTNYSQENPQFIQTNYSQLKAIPLTSQTNYCQQPIEQSINMGESQNMEMPNIYGTTPNFPKIEEPTSFNQTDLNKSSKPLMQSSNTLQLSQVVNDPSMVINRFPISSPNDIKIDSKYNVIHDDRFSCYNIEYPVKYYYEVSKEKEPSVERDWYIRPHHTETFSGSKNAIPDDILNTKYISYYGPPEKEEQEKTRQELLEELIEETQSHIEQLKYEMFRDANNSKEKEKIFKRLENVKEEALRDYKPGMFIDEDKKKKGKNIFGILAEKDNKTSYSEMFNNNDEVKQMNLAIDAYGRMLKELRDRERELLVEKRKEEYERIRPPVKNWYQLKGAEFQKEMQRNKMVINAGPEYFEKIQALKDEDLY